MVGNALLILYVWGLHVVVASLVVVPLVWLTQVRRRVLWRWWETAAFVVPFSVWIWLSATNLRPKSIANFAEAYAISIAIAVAAVIRALVTKPRTSALVIAVLLAGLTATAVAIYFLTPPLPE